MPKVEPPKVDEQVAKKLTKVNERKDKARNHSEVNMFDSNLASSIEEQKKIIYGKNYELDSRAWGIKDFGFQPYLKEQIEKKRRIDHILFQTKNDDRLPLFKKKFTPVTNFMKSVMDSKITF